MSSCWTSASTRLTNPFVVSRVEVMLETSTSTRLRFLEADEIEQELPQAPHGVLQRGLLVLPLDARGFRGDVTSRNLQSCSDTARQTKTRIWSSYSRARRLGLKSKPGFSRMARASTRPEAKARPPSRRRVQSIFFYV